MANTKMWTNQHAAFVAAHARATPSIVQLPSQRENGPVRPFDLSQIKSAPIKIIHPCTEFAHRAGLQSWDDAITAIKAGKIVVGPAPTIGKSMIGLTMFLDQIKKDGLFTVGDDFGRVAVSFRENFPTETLARIDAERAARVTQYAQFD